MNERLHRKKRGGEFTELGFELRGALHPGLVRAELDAFFDRLLDVVEARNLSIGGRAGRDDALDYFVTCDGRASAAEEDRATLIASLSRDTAVARHEEGALRDAWDGA